jgi:hypothetical protein
MSKMEKGKKDSLQILPRQLQPLGYGDVLHDGSAMHGNSLTRLKAK